MSGSIDDIKKERERFVAFAFAAAELFFEIDAKGKVVFEGGAVDRIGAKPGSSLIGDNIYDHIDPDDRDVFSALLVHLEHKGRIGPIPVRFTAGQGRGLALRLFALRMPAEADRIFLALRAAPLGTSGSSDVSISAETGLMTRESFMKLAGETMRDNPAGNNLYMTAVEVDGIEEAKKKFGPQYMRTLLKQVAAHLKTLSVDGEIAGQIDDRHFAFLHRAKGDGKQLEATLAKVDDKVKLKAAYSTLASDFDDVSEDQILRTLSYVLNQFCAAKGKVDFESLSSAYEDMAGDAQRRVVQMRNMIETGSFNIAFQPVVSLSNGDIHHNEVLSRFDERMGDSTPLEVIRFAEEVGIIEEFDIAISKKAIDYVRKMKKLGTPLTLAVNLSGRTIESDRYLAALMDVFQGAKDVSRSILLELTETAAITKLEKAEAVFNDLKALDYRICLDDFGAGAAGYQYLRAFNVDYVKIDGEYVRDMNSPGYRPTFLLSIVRLCADLGVKTIGEHVENRFQADFLRSLGVDFGQGFHFGKPDFSPKTN
ncbi:EAL domain-containing protein [Kordiimonas aestuarii]|uniref:EAL domain-containing protein n=1 Tax=Kordiimonas aestuarii TaxID=1005925 RepID=UPI0021D25A40|nr:EAL domain-containing protein [Kordiimonas aestuarii]